MPFSVKLLLAIHFLILAYFIIISFNALTGIFPLLDPASRFSAIKNSPFYIFLFGFWLFTVCISIAGFFRAKAYARNISLAFYGFVTLYVGGLLLDIFHLNSIKLHQGMAFNIYAVELVFFIFILYLLLRPDVYHYVYQENTQDC